jgi:hypothetical protein
MASYYNVHSIFVVFFSFICQKLFTQLCVSFHCRSIFPFHSLLLHIGGGGGGSYYIPLNTWRFYICNTAAGITKCCLDKVLTHKRKIIVTATLSIGQIYKETQESYVNDAEGKGIVSSHQRIQRTVRSNDNPEPRSSHLTN